MMSPRPYFAVIVDSFRAALSSRVLWVAMVMLWLFLLLLAPFGYREDFTTRFRWQDFHNGTRMKAMLARGLVAEHGDQTPEGRLAGAMPEELKRQLQQVGKSEVRIRYGILVDALNELIEDESWYDETVWKSALRLRELREMDKLPRESLSESLQKRRARLRIEAAFPGVFNTRSARSVVLTYGGWDFPATWGFVVDKARFQMLINQFVMPLLINWLLGFAFILLGILVTSSIVPEMLQPGSLHLLLSKPINRSLLLASKFIGGCAFVLMCVCQLILGLYLIAGFRLDLWNPRLFWCIPVSVLMFAVYYSVSVAAGLLWRSAILSISVTVVFGAICFLVGFFSDLFETAVKQPKQINGIALVGEDLFASNRGGGLVRFDSDENRWEEIFSSGLTNPDRTLAPVAVDDQHLVTARIRNGRFNPFGNGAPELIVLSRDGKWSPEPSLRLPTATTRIFHAGDNGIMAMNTGELSVVKSVAVLEAAGEPVESDKKTRDKRAEHSAAEDSSSAKPHSWLSKINSMIGSKTDGFHDVLPAGVTLTSPRTVVVSADGSSLTIATSGRVLRLEPGNTEGQTPYSITAEFSIDGDRSSRSHLALAGDLVLLARKDESMKLLDSRSLQIVGEVELPKMDFATQLVGLQSEQVGPVRFLVLTSDGVVRPLEIHPLEKTGSGSSHTTSWGKSLVRHEVDWIHYEPTAGKIYLVHHNDQIHVFGDDAFQFIDSISANLSGWRSLDYWLIRPLQTVIPQTGALGETTASLISGRSAVEIGQVDEQSDVYRYKFSKPIISCVLFVLVVMSINCLYFSTRDY